MIKFNQFNVQDTVSGVKSKVFYSINNRRDGRNCVTIYSKDYGRALGVIFAEIGGYKNDTDIMTDYFDKGQVNLFEDSPLYAQALARAKLNEAKSAAKGAARQAKWDAARKLSDAAPVF